MPVLLICFILLFHYSSGFSKSIPSPSLMNQVDTILKKVLEYYKTHEINDYDKSIFYNTDSQKLTELFYSADRTVRESGFDITAKFGPFSAAIQDYAPVDLNVLLYQMEKDLQNMYSLTQDNLAAAH